MFCCVQTFTTAETMLNARTVRQWIIASLGAEAVKKHMVAVSTNLKLVQEFEKQSVVREHPAGAGRARRDV